MHDTYDAALSYAAAGVQLNRLLADPIAPNRRYAIARTIGDGWVVTDAAGVNGGLFSSRAAAIHFIRMDCGCRDPIRE